MKKLVGNQNGMALVTVLIISVLLAILGSAALMATTTEIKISGNYKMSIEGAECAHAGIAEAARMLVNKKASGDSSAQWSFSSNVSGYNNRYTISYLTVEDSAGDKKRIFDDSGNPYYQIDSAGILPNSGGAEINKRAIIRLKRKPLFQYSFFGNELVEYKNESITDSYDSTTGGYDTTVANRNSFLASNGAIILEKDSIVNGNIRLGKDSLGTPGSLTSDNTTITGTIDSIDRIDPNPLGNQLDNYIDNVTFNNDNFDIDEAYLDGDDLMLAEGDTLNLSSGSYYFTDIVLNKGSVLNIGGEVKIFLDGGLYMEGDANIMTGSGTPADLIVFSNSTEDIVIENSTDFCGCIYAPYAKTTLKSSGDFYGALWAGEIINDNGMALHYDEAIGDQYTTGDYTGFELVSLREVY
ncbi:MAG: hypothetical protein JRE23_14665 [Deltaproteobacteria bacterium]|nr:hypothetical protein [Deltaproteobacteria bacterium]